MGAVRNREAYGVNLRWRANTTLTIEYLEAKQADVATPSASVGGERVDVILKSGILDPTAPAGGMLYNRQKTPMEEK